MRRLDKKGEGTPVWIIIALALGILVLIVVALGFTGTWGTLWSKITGWTGGEESLSDASQVCKIASSSNDEPALNKARNVQGLSDVNLRKLDDTLKLTYKDADGNDVDAGVNSAKLGEEEISLTINGQTVKISKEKVVSGVTCEILKSKGLIVY